jgi:hypothetical protein
LRTVGLAGDFQSPAKKNKRIATHNAVDWDCASAGRLYFSSRLFSTSGYRGFSISGSQHLAYRGISFFGKQSSITPNRG